MRAERTEFLLVPTEFARLAKMSILAENLLDLAGDAVLEELMSDSGIDNKDDIQRIEKVSLVLTDDGPELYIKFDILKRGRKFQESFRAYCDENNSLKGDYLL
jgi:hypothetical protein